MDHEGMVAEVKRLQKEDPVAKEQWSLYCDRDKGGVKDPMKHEERSLETFLISYKDGARISGGLGGGGGGGGGGGAEGSGDDWVVVFKEMQRNSQPFRASWSGYCQAMGHGKCDPSKHGKDFLVRFLDQLAASASAMGGAAHNSGPPAAKRPRVAGGGGGPVIGFGAPKGAGKGGMAVGMDSRKHQLAERVKAYQRSGQIEKESWSAHCDEHLGGVKDPARIESSDLQAFIESYGVP